MADLEQNSNEEESLVPGRIPLAEVKKQAMELRQAKKTFESMNPRSKKIYDAVSMYSVAIDFAFIIAVPLIAFVYIGRWADQRYNTKYLVLIGILIGLTISTVGIAKQIKKLSDQLKNKK